MKVQDRKAYSKKYYQEHRKWYLEANRRFRMIYPGYHRKYQEQQSKYKRGWYEENRERWNEYMREYRAKQKFRKEYN